MCWMLAMFLCGLPLPATTAPRGLENAAPDIQSLIARLADPDPRVRDQTAGQIVEVGVSARPAVLAAWRSGDPRIVPAAARLLLQLPWTSRRDAPAIRQLLRDYGAKDESARQEAAKALLRLPGGSSALIRILREDPSDTLSWTAYVLLVLLQDESADAQLRALDLNNERVPVIVASARAWLSSDWKKGLTLLGHALDADRRRSTRDQGYLNFAFDLLTADAVESGRFDQAAEWRRRQALRAASGVDPSRAVLSLFALHGNFGPLAGFDDDRQSFEDDLARPEVLYSIALAHDRAGNGLLAIAFRRMALAASLVAGEEHLTAGEWLLEQSWTVEASREFHAAVDTGHALGAGAKSVLDATATYMLARLSAEIDDDAAAADAFTAAQELADKSAQPEAPSAMASTIHHHRLRVALQSHDEAGAKKEIDAILAGSQDDPDVAIDLFSYLSSHGRADEAQQHFDRAYQIQKSRVARDPTSAQEMNNLAWLLARCRQHPDEAVEMSRKATRLVPESAGYWDTAAEVHFAAGRAADAVRLERRALSLKPNDHFMLQQLARFAQEAGQ
jgi:tetratricopeptide (TPR) repeat protein